MYEVVHVKIKQQIMKFQVLSSKTLLSSVGPTVAVTVWPGLWAGEWAFWLSKGSLVHHREGREAWGSPGCSRFGSHSVWESIRCLSGCPESSGQCRASAVTPSSLKCHTKKLSLILRGEPNQSMLWVDHETNKEKKIIQGCRREESAEIWLCKCWEMNTKS